MAAASSLCTSGFKARILVSGGSFFFLTNFWDNNAPLTNGMKVINAERKSCFKVPLAFQDCEILHTFFNIWQSFCALTGKITLTFSFYAITVFVVLIHGVQQPFWQTLLIGVLVSWSMKRSHYMLTKYQWNDKSNHFYLCWKDILQ